MKEMFDVYLVVFSTEKINFCDILLIASPKLL